MKNNMSYSIGKQLKILMALRGISKPELAKELKMSKQQLYLILENKRIGTLQTIEKIATILDVPTDLLFRDIDRKFKLFAIDDYLSCIDKEIVEDTFSNIMTILTNEGIEHE